MPTTAHLAFSLTTLLVIASLSSGCHVHHPKPVFTSAPPSQVVVPEIEVNDFSWAPQNIGTVHAGQTFYLEGSITDLGWDPRDGYQFFAETPLLVNVSLEAHVPGVDLDWCVWDPTFDQYTVCAETINHPETGSFFVVPPGNEFHLVASSYSGTSTYTMAVTFSPYFAATAEEPATEREFPTSRTDESRDYNKSEVVTKALQIRAFIID